MNFHKRTTDFEIIFQNEFPIKTEKNGSIENWNQRSVTKNMDQILLLMKNYWIQKEGKILQINGLTDFSLFLTAFAFSIGSHAPNASHQPKLIEQVAHELGKPYCPPAW